MATYVLTIGGEAIDADNLMLLPGWTIDKSQNARWTLRLRVLVVDADWVPEFRDEVVFTRDGSVNNGFGGEVQSVSVKGVGDNPAPVILNIDVGDFSSRAEITVNAEIPAGTLKEALEYLAPYLDGLTLDPTQAVGPSLDAGTFIGWHIIDILKEYNRVTGWLPRFAGDKTWKMIEPGTATCPFAAENDDAHIISDVEATPVFDGYYNRVWVYGTGVTGLAEDAGEIIAHHIREISYQAPEITDVTEADTRAALILAESLPFVQRLSYLTDEFGAEPGQTQSIDIDERQVQTTCLITETTQTGDEDGQVRTRVTAIEGQAVRPGWRDKLQQGALTGGTGVMSGGGSGLTLVVATYPFGTVASEAVWSPGSAGWVDAAVGQVEIDTVARGSLSITVRLMLRVATSGVAVKARLYDVSNSAACPGESTTVTSDTFTFRSFVATLTAGAFRYKLQLHVDTAEENAYSANAYAA